MKYGIRLYSIRHLTPINREGVLRALSEIGYTGDDFGRILSWHYETVTGGAS